MTEWAPSPPPYVVTVNLKQDHGHRSYTIDDPTVAYVILNNSIISLN